MWASTSVRSITTTGVHAKHRLTRYHDFFVDRIEQGERVLDVGCGKGELAHDIAERTGANVTAIDANPWMLEFARKRSAHPRVTYVQADAVDFTVLSTRASVEKSFGAAYRWPLYE